MPPVGLGLKMKNKLNKNIGHTSQQERPKTARLSLPFHFLLLSLRLSFFTH
jgi:hypothetical protein